MKVDELLKKFIKFLFPALFFLVPLFFLPFNYELFEFNKIILVYLLTILIVAAWIGRMVIQKKFIFKRTFLDIPLLIFFLSQILSTIFSIDPHTSIFGYYSRFNGGLLSITSYLLLYWAFVSNSDKIDVFRSVKALLISAAIVSVYGILEHFGYSFSCLMFGGRFDVACWVQDVKNRVFATLGQPNWLAAFLDVLIPVAISYFLAAKNKTQRVYYLILTALYFSCLIFTGSRSGFLGLVVSLITYWLMAFISDRQQIKIFLKPFVILNSIFLLIIVIFGSPFPQINNFLYSKNWLERLSHKTVVVPAQPAGPALEVGGTESGKIRQIVWKGAFRVFQHYPILGSGVETFAYSYYNFRPVEHNLVSEWDFLYNKAHNEFLNYLATTGIVGLGSYLLLIIIFIVSIVKGRFGCMLPRNKNSVSQTVRYQDSNLVLALLSGWLSVLITNFFGFSVVLVSLLFYLIPAFIFVLQKIDNQINQQDNKPTRYQLSVFPLIILLSVTIYSLFSVINLWRADFFYSQGQKLAKQSEYVLSYQALNKAVELNPREPVLINELSSSVATLALLSSSQEATTSAEELSAAAVSFSDKALKISPRNLNLWKTRIKVFYTISLVDKKYFPMAIESTLEAMKLSPTDPKLVYNLGLLYGRNGEVQKALETIETAIKLKPNYEEARNSLAIFYEEMGQKDKALEQLEIILQGKPNDEELKARIEKLKQ